MVNDRVKDVLLFEKNHIQCVNSNFALCRVTLHDHIMHKMIHGDLVHGQYRQEV